MRWSLLSSCGLLLGLSAEAFLLPVGLSVVPRRAIRSRGSALGSVRVSVDSDLTLKEPVESVILLDAQESVATMATGASVGSKRVSKGLAPKLVVEGDVLESTPMQR
jgi:hypothetical protein